MNLNQLMSQLENKIVALKDKSEVAFSKGLHDIGLDIQRERYDTEIMLNELKRITTDVVFFEAENIKSILSNSIKKRLPDFTFFFRKSAIENIIDMAVKDALDEFLKEYIQKKLIWISAKVDISEKPKEGNE